MAWPPRKVATRCGAAVLGRPSTCVILSEANVAPAGMSAVASASSRRYWQTPARKDAGGPAGKDAGATKGQAIVFTALSGAGGGQEAKDLKLR